MNTATTLTDIQALALTGWAEARSEFVKGKWRTSPLVNMVAVMCTPINRLRASPERYGSTLHAVCFQHNQYSCWNANSGKNHDDVMAQMTHVLNRAVTDHTLFLCLTAAQQLVNGVRLDIVNGATHYYAPDSMIPPGRIPTWAIGHQPVASIGGQLFFKGV